MNAAALIGLSVLLQAAAEAFLAGRISSGDSLRFSAVAFLGCTVLFAVVARRQRRTHRVWAPGPARRLFLLLNVASAVTFLGLYLSLVWVPAALAASLMAGAGPLASAVISASSKGRRTSPGTWIRSAGLLVAAVAAAAAVQPSALEPETWQAGPLATLAGAVLAVVSGAGAAGIAHLSVRLGELETAPVLVMAHRFHLTYVLALAALASGSLTDPPRLGAAVTCAVAFAGVVLPLYILQIGVQRAPAMVTMALLAAQPGLTYAAQAVLGDHVTWRGSVAVTLLIALAVAVARAEHRSPAGTAPVVPSAA